MEQNRNDVPARILATLQAELIAARRDSDRLINALEKFGESIGESLIPGIKDNVFLPLEIEKAVLETELENRKRRACLHALKSFNQSINYMNSEISRAENEFSRDWEERQK